MHRIHPESAEDQVMPQSKTGQATAGNSAPPIPDSLPETRLAALPESIIEPAAAAILLRAQAGDHLAFSQLYSLHKRRVYSLCLRMLGNVAEAEDLTQESFLQLHRKIFQPEVITISLLVHQLKLYRTEMLLLEIH